MLTLYFVHRAQGARGESKPHRRANDGYAQGGQEKDSVFSLASRSVGCCLSSRVEREPTDSRHADAGQLPGAKFLLRLGLSLRPDRVILYKERTVLQAVSDPQRPGQLLRARPRPSRQPPRRHARPAEPPREQPPLAERRRIPPPSRRPACRRTFALASALAARPGPPAAGVCSGACLAQRTHSFRPP